MPLKANWLAFRVAVIYVIVAGGWILFSDKLVASFISNPDERVFISIIKGWGFVLLTGGLLFWMLQRWSSQWEQQAEQLKAAADNLHRTDRALRTLSAGNQVLVRATSEPSLLREICRAIVEQGGYRMAWVGFPENDAEKSVRFAAAAGGDEGYLAQSKISWDEASERGRGPTGTALRTGQRVVCQNFQTDPQVSPWRAEAAQRGYTASIALPLQKGVETFGVLTLYAAEAGAFNPTEIALLAKLADDLAYGIQARRTQAEHYAAEASLRRERGLYLDLVNTLPAGMYRLRVQPAAEWNEANWRTQFESLYSVDFVSDRFCELIGVRREEFVANPKIVPDRVHPEDRPGFIQRNVEAVVARSLFSWEGRLVVPENRTCWIHLESIPRQFENGEVIWTGIAYDITARKAAEAAQQRQTEELRARNDELTRFNRVAVGRELSMIELKREVNELCGKQGEAPRHRIVGHPVSPSTTPEVQP